MNNQSGQIGLVVLLVMMTMLTVGVGTIARSTQDLRLTRQEVESSQAFNEAEKGIEQALAEIDAGVQDPGGQLTSDVGQVSYDVEVRQEAEIELRSGETLKIDLSGTNDISNRIISINWANEYSCHERQGTQTEDEPPYLIISQMNRDTDTGRLSEVRTGVSLCETNFEGFTLNQTGSFDLSVNNQTEEVKIRMVGNGSRIQVQGSNFDLPPQGHRIDSRASLEETEEQRRAVLERSLPRPVGILDYAVYSQGTISIN